VTDAPPRPLRAPGDVAGALDTLRAAGHRVSAPARTVLEALFAADGPISAERIAADGHLEATSVYRNLLRFQDLGLVGHVHIGHGAGLWALAGDGPREYLVCERCSRVTVVEAAHLDGVRGQIQDAFGYRVRFSHFPLHGYCASCAEALDLQDG
jgi:Fur family ferric uptake transcriptional regulator